MNQYEEKFYVMVRNAAKCGVCGDEIESNYRHDFVSCKCGNVSVDGGREYVRRAFKTNNYTDLTEYRKMTQGEMQVTMNYYTSQYENDSCGMKDFYGNIVQTGDALYAEWYGNK